jgi:hypothetical protein
MELAIDISTVSADNRNCLCELFSKDATHVIQLGWSVLKFCVMLQPFLFLSSFKPTGMPWWLWDVCPVWVVLAAFVAVKRHSEGVEVKWSLSLINNHTVKAYGTAEVWLCILLISALDGVERLASCPGSFIHWERAHGTHWLGDWVAPRTGLDTGENKEMLPLPGIRPCFLSHPSHILDFILTELSQLHKTNESQKQFSYQTACSQFYNNLETFVSESLA